MPRRICDSHNLNASPLCELSRNTMIPKWAQEVKELYGDLNVPDYISSLATPMRDIYKDEKMKNEELLETLTKVICTLTRLKSKVFSSVRGWF